MAAAKGQKENHQNVEDIEPLFAYKYTKYSGKVNMLTKNPSKEPACVRSLPGD
jgi:hypothetical protein